MRNGVVVNGKKYIDAIRAQGVSDHEIRETCGYLEHGFVQRIIQTNAIARPAANLILIKYGVDWKDYSVEKEKQPQKEVAKPDYEALKIAIKEAILEAFKEV